jgi:type I restriction-modification system DNA methylase subunit
MKEQAYNQISELVKRFEEQYDSYKNGSYNETATRRDFIDPFFKALGWDIDNSQGAAEAYREVIHEDKVTIDDQVKSPDYSFRLQGGKRLFFVEAKKPSVFIKESIPPAYQVKRYAWSAKLPVSLLTDFEEFAVYDCTTKPKPTDKASIGRIKYLTFREYLAEFDFLWNTFAKENVLRGSFDKFVLSDKGKKGTSTVDKEFLLSLDEWRKLLAVDISKNNKTLDESSINHAVQQTIDRIIFLRICEDRNIEPNNRLATYVSGKNCYENMFEYFLEADKKYNSGLFDFKKDKISKDLVIQDKVLKEIIEGLYYPKCPFEFSVLPVEILGSAYEQFLGKVIRLTAGHNAKVEEKPEVRKAGGVYYTPQYIVEYIVKNTVGKLVEGKTPAEVEKIKILDPACGSGSFLIGAYQYLLDWHLKHYNESGKKDKTLLTPDGTLTTAIKKKILLNNIFGVDLDAQAVEVTKLSLLLKCMEGETQASIKNQMALFHERVLPSLETNIKCGNSLIGTDFYKSAALNLFDDEHERRRINAFDWDGKDGFPEIMKRGGFDAVIGNPPYVRSQHLEEKDKEYFYKIFIASMYQPDTFALFMEKGTRLLHENGYLGFIIPNGILTNTCYQKLRLYSLDNTCLEVVIDLKSNVFINASVDTSIFILRQCKDKKIRDNHKVRIGQNSDDTKRFVNTPDNEIRQSIFYQMPENAFNTNVNVLSMGVCNKVKLRGQPARNFIQSKAGMKVRKDFICNSNKNAKYKPFVLGSSIQPYSIKWENKWVCYDKSLEDKFSNQAFRDEAIFVVTKKILVRQVMGKNRIFASIDVNQFFVDQTVYILLPIDDSISSEYILGIICSRLMAYYFNHTLSDAKTLFPKIKASQIEQLPIIVPDITNRIELTIASTLANKVSLLLALNVKHEQKTTTEKQLLFQRQIDATDKEIDKLVYELYGLTEDEIKIVEGSAEKKPSGG